jgi:hypothetical protein
MGCERDEGGFEVRSEVILVLFGVQPEAVAVRVCPHHHMRMINLQRED